MNHTRRARRVLRAHRRMVVTLVALAIIVLGCAPGYSTIYDSNSNIVSGGTGAQSIRQNWAQAGVTHTTRNYTGASWTYDCNTKDNYALRVNGVTPSGSMPDNGAYGGLIRASAPAGSYPWEDPGDLHGYHNCPGIKSETNGFVYDRWHISQVGDGMVFRDEACGSSTCNGSNTRFSRSWVYKSGDDCVQSDSGGNGNAIEDNLLDQCWVGISARQGVGEDFHTSSIDIVDNIVYVADHTSCYKPGTKPCPSHGGWLKWDNQCPSGPPGLEWQCPLTATKATIRDNVFIASTYPRNSGDLKENAPIDPTYDLTSTPDTNEACDGNTLILLNNNSADVNDFFGDALTWVAAGCTHTTVMVGGFGSSAFTTAANAINNWHEAHDALIQQPGTP